MATDASIHRAILSLLRVRKDKARKWTVDSALKELERKPLLATRHAAVLSRLQRDPDVVVVSPSEFVYTGLRVEIPDIGGLADRMNTLFPTSWPRKDVARAYDGAEADLQGLIESKAVNVVRQTPLNRINPRQRGMDPERVAAVYAHIRQKPTSSATFAELLKWDAKIDSVLEYMSSRSVGLLRVDKQRFHIAVVEEAEYICAASPLGFRPPQRASLLRQMALTPSVETGSQAVARLGVLKVQHEQWFTDTVVQTTSSALATAKKERAAAAALRAAGAKRAVIKTTTNQHLVGKDGYEFLQPPPKRLKSV